MILEKTYYPTVGLSFITDASIVYAKMLFVARSGVEFNVDTVALNEDGGNYCLYTASTGTINFNPDQPFISGESINIIYDTNP